MGTPNVFGFEQPPVARLRKLLYSWTSRWTKWTSRLLAVIVVAFMYWFIVLNFRMTPLVHLDHLRQVGKNQNQTLGFGGVIAVSSGTTWRVHELIEAAERTGINIDIPPQPNWSTAEVDIFRGVGVKGRDVKLGPGQARCWLGHLNALLEILRRGWTTALVLEDDADWDIAIKQQLSLVAPLIRNITKSGHTNGRDSPYGNSWDLLWLGHCGELPADGSEVGLVIDETLPSTPLYRQAYGEYTYHPPQLRMVHLSKMPVCTYAYAVTSGAAFKIYQLAVGGKDRIITMELRDWCRKGYLKCVTVNPELFHHHKKAGEISSEIAAIEGWDDLAASAPVGYTANIRYSARCNIRSKGLVSCQSEK